MQPNKHIIWAMYYKSVFPENSGTPKLSILIGLSIIFTIHFGGNTPIFGNTQILNLKIFGHFGVRIPLKWRLGNSFPPAGSLVDIIDQVNGSGHKLRSETSITKNHLHNNTNTGWWLNQPI